MATSALNCRQRTPFLCPSSTLRSRSVLLSQICGVHERVRGCVWLITQYFVLFSATLCKLGHYHKHYRFYYFQIDLGHTCNVAAANLYCAVTMSCHYFFVVILQAPDLTASLDPSEDVVAPPPVCLQGLGNGMEC